MVIYLADENGISVSDAIKITELENTVQNLENKIEELEAKNSELETKNNSLIEELTGIKGKSAVLGELETKKIDLESEVSTLNQQISEYQTEKETVKMRFTIKK
ncbi:unnamed protein product [marine sediment metagenome]|uniref:Uncharacterized protein n=1 Tax=marine sediment metagenome TaxID=412755 RepID=X1I5R4_9ZZZZ